MKNFLTGWATTILGVAILITATLDFFGFITVVKLEGISKIAQVGIAFGGGLALFLVPSTFIEEKLKQIINRKIDKESK